jgi:hypothetical protein
VCHYANVTVPVPAVNLYTRDPDLDGSLYVRPDPTTNGGYAFEYAITTTPDPPVPPPELSDLYPPPPPPPVFIDPDPEVPELRVEKEVPPPPFPGVPSTPLAAA